MAWFPGVPPTDDDLWQDGNARGKGKSLLENETFLKKIPFYLHPLHPLFFGTFAAASRAAIKACRISSGNPIPPFPAESLLIVG